MPTDELPPIQYVCRNCGATLVPDSEEEKKLTRPCHKCHGTMDMIEP